MTVFGLLLIIVYIILLVKKQNPTEKYIQIMAFLLGVGAIVQIGYFIKIGNFDISYGFASEIVAALYSVIWMMGKKVVILRRNIIAMVGVILCMILGLIGLIISPYPTPIVTRGISWDEFVLGYAQKVQVSFSFFNVQELLKYVLFFIICVAIRMLSDSEKKEIVFQMGEICKPYLVYCTLELILKNLFQSDALYVFQQALFGVVGATQNDLRKRGFLYSLQGLTKEPSYYISQMMLIILLLVLQQKIGGKKNKVWIYFAIIFMAASMSLSSVLYIGTLGLLYLLYAKDSKRVNMVGLLILFIIVSVIILVPVWLPVLEQSYVGRRLINLFNDVPNIISGAWTNRYNSEISNRSRMMSIWEAVTICMSRPLFGLGAGSINSFSSILAFLADNGILALIFWIMAVPLGEKVMSKKYIKAVFIWFIPLLLTTAESPFWTSFGLVSLLLLLPLLFNEEKISHNLGIGGLYERQNQHYNSYL